jgi:hypothetical protein
MTDQPIGTRVSSLNTKFVASIAERDVDLVVLEELTVSEEFAEFFTSRAFEKAIWKTTLDAVHSYSMSDLGETDLVYIFESVDGRQLALLVENKIDAPPQPEQAVRYKKRGKLGQEKEYWNDFRTVLIAPRRYLGSSKNTGTYDIELAYEELLSYFVSRRSRDPRFGYKARVIQEAIDQNRRGYQPTFSKEMTAFVEAYTKEALQWAPELNVEPAKKRPAGSTWIQFRPKGLPEGVTVFHQMTRGAVKMFWAGQAADEAVWRQQWDYRKPEGAFLELTGKSMAMSMEVPLIDPLAKPFDVQVAAVREALDAAKRLLNAVWGAANA